MISASNFQTPYKKFTRIVKGPIENILLKEGSFVDTEPPPMLCVSESSSSSIWRNVLRGHAGLCRLLRLNSLPHSRIANPCYGGTVHSRLEPMTDMFLSRTS